QPFRRFTAEPGMLGEVHARSLRVLPRGLVGAMPAGVDRHQVPLTHLQSRSLEVASSDIFVRPFEKIQDRAFAQKPVDGDLMKIPPVPAKMTGGVHVSPRVGEE